MESARPDEDMPPAAGGRTAGRTAPATSSTSTLVRPSTTETLQCIRAE